MHLKTRIFQKSHLICGNQRQFVFGTAPFWAHSHFKLQEWQFDNSATSEVSVYFGTTDFPTKISNCLFFPSYYRRSNRFTSLTVPHFFVDSYAEGDNDCSSYVPQDSADFEVGNLVNSVSNLCQVRYPHRVWFKSIPCNIARYLCKRYFYA